MPSALFEVYVKYNFPSYDARTGHGYGVVNSKSQKERPSVGTQLQKDNFYPYTRPPKEATGNEEDDEETPSKIKRKIVAKIGGPVHINDPFSKNWTDRGAFVNGASRLDLGLAENIFTISDIDSNISPLYSRGGNKPDSCDGKRCWNLQDKAWQNNRYVKCRKVRSPRRKKISKKSTPLACSIYQSLHERI